MEKFRKSQLINRKGEITQIGQKVNELIRADLLIHNQHDPEVTFAMSPEYEAQITEKRDGVLEELQLPEDRGQIMKQGQEILIEAGHPYWKVGESNGI